MQREYVQKVTREQNSGKPVAFIKLLTLFVKCRGFRYRTVFICTFISAKSTNTRKDLSLVLISVVFRNKNL